MTLDPQTYEPTTTAGRLRRRRSAAPDPVAEAREPHPRIVFAGPLVAIISMILALLVTDAAGVSLRDPDHVAGRRLAMVLALVVVLMLLDVLVRAALRSPGRLPTWAALAAVRRERWTLSRLAIVLSALISFYVSYLAYRNLKSVVPLIRPDDLFDRQLADVDRSLFVGHEPAALLHNVMGTGASSQFMSFVYMLFFAFIPGTLAAAVVFTRNLQAGLFYVTAQSLNWLLGAASYFLLPSLGPIYAAPGDFAHLPPTEVTNLQQILLDQRIEFLRDPAVGTAQSIAAFSSLHVAIFFTGALMAHLLGVRLSLRIWAWILLGLTTLATIYLGWHYVVDDIGGLVVGAGAILLARVVTGLDPRVTTAREAPAPA